MAMMQLLLQDALLHLVATCEQCCMKASLLTLSATWATIKRGMSHRRRLFGFRFLESLGLYLKAGTDWATETICNKTACCG